MNRWRWMLLLAGVIITLMLLKAFAFTLVELKDAAFSYRPEAEAMCKMESIRLMNQNNGFEDKRQELEAFNQIYKTMDGTDRDISLWNATGGPSPQQFRVRIRVRNYGNQASKETPVNVTLSAKVGEYYVDQQAFMVDQQHLQKTAKWIPMQTLHGSIPVLASNETYDYFTEPILFGAFLLSLQHQFPVALKANVALAGSKTGKTIEIPVNADHFALEDLQH